MPLQSLDNGSGVQARQPLPTSDQRPDVPATAAQNSTHVRDTNKIL